MLPGRGGGSLPVAVAGLCSQCSPLPALLGWAWVTGDENMINTEQYFFHPHSYQTSPWYVICLEKSPYPILAQSIPLLCSSCPSGPPGPKPKPFPSHSSSSRAAKGRKPPRSCSASPGLPGTDFPRLRCMYFVNLHIPHTLATAADLICRVAYRFLS